MTPEKLANRISANVRKRTLAQNSVKEELKAKRHRWLSSVCIDCRLHRNTGMSSNGNRYTEYRQTITVNGVVGTIITQRVLPCLGNGMELSATMGSAPEES